MEVEEGNPLDVEVQGLLFLHLPSHQQDWDSNHSRSETQEEKTNPKAETKKETKTKNTITKLIGLRALLIQLTNESF